MRTQIHRPRRDFLRFAATAPALLIAGCAGLIPGTGQAPQLYVLSRKTTFPPELPTVRDQLLVDVPVATGGIDTTRIVLSRSPTTIDYFANAAWSDRAPVMVQALLIESFETTGKIIGISRDEAGLRADYVLMPELRRFEAIYATDGAVDAPPTVLTRLLVRLVRMPDRTIIGETVAERREPAARNALEAIVDAYNEALGGVMKDIVTWTLHRMSEDASAGPGVSKDTPRPRL
jgi:cholesterol transport system auxiliary component